MHIFTLAFQFLFLLLSFINGSFKKKYFTEFYNWSIIYEILY